MLKATVSGSFHRHMPAIYTAVGELRAQGVDVLSPSDPRIVDNIGEFLFVASDRLRSIKLVQDRHFEAIRNSDFLWVVCPDGYTGPSTSAEIGAAHICRTPVFSDHPARDITIGQYVRTVASIKEAIAIVSGGIGPKNAHSASPLLDPHNIEHSMQMLDSFKTSLLGKTNETALEIEDRFSSVKDHFARSLS